ncbi:adenylyltransferase/cytidyltransferase family protein [Shewanella waksmanii]|uniref:adenylyltransferase/cytidyltransferase family protein n=1 Tax=Shewanella waksmanii TaxID=213783 RepID=UPI003734C471
MKTIITYGTFDLFHYGHVRLLKRLKALGDRLIVAVSTDEFNAIKGKAAFFSHAQRVEMLQACKHVDLVIAETHWQQKIADIKRYNVDTFAIGNDWQGSFDFLKQYCEVVYLTRTQDVSTTDIKVDLRQPSE